MIKIPNKLIPFGNYKYITIWPCLFYKEPLVPIVINHENIHGRQYIEFLSIGLILLLIKILIFGSGLINTWLILALALSAFYWVDLIDCAFNKTDRGALERECYENENNLNYLKTRKLFQMWRK